MADSSGQSNLLGKRDDSHDKDLLQDTNFLKCMFDIMKNKYSRGSNELFSKKTDLRQFKENLHKRLETDYFAKKCFAIFYDLVLNKKKKADQYTDRSVNIHKLSQTAMRNSHTGDQNILQIILNEYIPYGHYDYAMGGRASDTKE